MISKYALRSEIRKNAVDFLAAAVVELASCLQCSSGQPDERETAHKDNDSSHESL